jgi:hypothetical protein
MILTKPFTAANFFAAFFLLVGLSIVDLRILGQTDILSKRPVVSRTFNRDQNKTTVSALLLDPQSDEFRGMLVNSPDHPPPDVRFHSVEYTYAGTTPARPQTVAFVFVPRDKYKVAPNVSITTDGTMLQQGEATLTELCCATLNGQNANPQHIIVMVPIATFEQITRAAKVDFKLSSKRGNYSFKLNDYRRKCLAALMATMTESKG